MTTTAQKMLISWIERARETSGMNNHQITKEVERVTGTKISSSVLMSLSKDGVANFKTVALIAEALDIPLPAVDEIGMAEEAEPFGGPMDRLVGAVLSVIGEAGTNLWTIKSEALAGAGIRKGDIAFANENVTPRHGDAVIVQVYDDEAGTAETLLRIYQPPYLVGQPQGRAAPPPIEIERDNARIAATITLSLRTRETISA